MTSVPNWPETLFASQPVERHGVYDFLDDKAVIPLAGGGELDLSADTALGAELASTPGDWKSLYRMAMSKTLLPRSKAEARFLRWCYKINDEVGEHHGDASLRKIDGRLDDLGLPALAGNVALEDGGGDGSHVPDFARRFKSVVFLDASLVNAVLARRLVDQNGLADRVVCVRADATRLPFKDGVFDFVHSVGVIEHVADRQSLVHEGIRVTNRNGYLVIGSPNRYPITREPHFQLPLFGLFPKPLRSRLIYLTRGATSEEGTDPLSLRDLRHTLTQAGVRSPEIFFVPRSLGKSARQTPARRIIVSVLSGPLGGALDELVNGALLPIAPSHLAIVRGDDRLDPAEISGRKEGLLPQQATLVRDEMGAVPLE